MNELIVMGDGDVDVDVDVIGYGDVIV